MVKKFAVLGLLTAALTCTAFGDAISFVFFGSANTPLVNIDTSGVTMNDGNLLAVTNHAGSVFFIPGTVDILTGPALSYVATSNSLLAQFAPGPGIEVEVNSADCGGPCLQGTLNTTGTYAASLNSTGSFQGLFKVTFVSPFITSLFGEANTWQPVGADTFTTSTNIFTSGGTTALADLGGGSVTFQTVPEPASLGLLGSGLVAAALGIRRRLA